MLKRKFVGVTVAVLLITTQMGCSSVSVIKKNETDVPSQQTSSQAGSVNNESKDDAGDKSSDKGGQDRERVLIDEFNALVRNNAGISDIVAFMDENISFVSPENVSVMINWLEEAQKEYLPILEEMINNSNAVKKNIEDELGAGLDISKADSTADEELKKLLTDMRDKGFKFETAEGYFFPVINYEFYKSIVHLQLNI